MNGGHVPDPQRPQPSSLSLSPCGDAAASSQGLWYEVGIPPLHPTAVSLGGSVGTEGGSRCWAQPVTWHRVGDAVGSIAAPLAPPCLSFPSQAGADVCMGRDGTRPAAGGAFLLFFFGRGRKNF